MSEQEIIDSEYAEHVADKIGILRKDERNTKKEMNLLTIGGKEWQALRVHINWIRAKKKEFTEESVKISNQ